MNTDDNFLYQLGEHPDRGFVERLREKLAQDQLNPAPAKASFPQALIWMRFAAIGLLLLVLLIIAMRISPVKAFVESFIARIAGQSFEQTTDYPGDDHSGAEQTIEPQRMPLSDALAAFPYRITMPGHIPPGYVLRESDVRVYVGESAGPFANTIELEWWPDSGRRLSLQITDRDYASTGEIVGPGAVAEILLDDVHPAALIRGGWDADNQVWRNDIGVRLRWQAGSLYYELSGLDPEQLIEIARSIIDQP
jgi:hypothetical protein